MLPKIIKDCILSIEGRVYAGIVDNIEWPKLPRKMEEFRAGGMFGPVEIELGMENMEISFEAPEQTREAILLFGVCGAGGIKLRLNASAESELDCSSYGIEVVMSGRMREIDLGSHKNGDLQKTKYTVSLVTFHYSIDGRTLFDIDFLNNIFLIDGRDVLEKRRRNLKM